MRSDLLIGKSGHVFWKEINLEKSHTHTHTISCHDSNRYLVFNQSFQKKSCLSLDYFILLKSVFVKKYS